jgi:Uma2 family endonuclease
MVKKTTTGTTTFAEFCELIHEDQKADLLDGVIYLASPESTDHNRLALWLVNVMGQFVEQRGLGDLFINKVAFRLSDMTSPKPDVAFVAANRLDRIKPGYVDGPPDLAIEIVSPDSIDRDYENKRRRYEEAGVREYWIIDPLENTATFLVREGDSFVEQFPRNHIYESRVLPGFTLDTQWLFQRPLPATMPIIRRLLGQE